MKKKDTKVKLSKDVFDDMMRIANLDKVDINLLVDNICKTYINCYVKEVLCIDNEDE